MADYMDPQRILEASRGANHSKGGLDLDEMRATLKRIGWSSTGGRAELEPVMADLYMSLTTPPSSLPADLMGLIAAAADSETRRAMIEGQVVSAGDTLYQTPLDKLSYTEIRTHAVSLPIPNKYDTHLHAIARALRTYIIARNKGPLSKCSDNVYAAMAYYLLTDGTTGLKVSDIKGLDVLVLIGDYGASIGRDNVAVNVVDKGDGSGEIRFLTDGQLHRVDGPSIIRYDTEGNVQSLYYIGGRMQRANGPNDVKYVRGNLRSESYWEDLRYHRIDGPAVTTYWPDGKIQELLYYVEGKKHRTDGPAVIKYHSDGTVAKEEYWTDNVRGY